MILRVNLFSTVWRTRTPLRNMDAEFRGSQISVLIYDERRYSSIGRPRAKQTRVAGAKRRRHEQPGQTKKPRLMWVIHCMQNACVIPYGNKSQSPPSFIDLRLVLYRFWVQLIAVFFELPPITLLFSVSYQYTSVKRAY
jgi:hypothetical protein